MIVNFLTTPTKASNWRPEFVCNLTMILSNFPNILRCTSADMALKYEERFKALDIKHRDIYTNSFEALNLLNEAHSLLWYIRVLVVGSWSTSAQLGSLNRPDEGQSQGMWAPHYSTEGGLSFSSNPAENSRFAKSHGTSHNWTRFSKEVCPRI